MITIKLITMVKITSFLLTYVITNVCPTFSNNIENIEIDTTDVVVSTIINEDEKELIL